ncbi:SseB family protein [Actinoplanes awajinensis]|uniref:SseB family protein n=1 Tax=Actinoplanes awajinensis TaxID=135946 RepID=UPI000B0159F3|nr:SseB family protein [Actinoplanes awajinensis]
MTGSDGWVPANEVEEAMVLAAVADERATYFQLIAVADLYLPQLTGDPSAEQRFVTVHAFGHVFLPVFTSVEALGRRFGHAVDGYTVTSFAELRRKWPDPDWRLAVNPGTPIDAYLPVESLADAAVGDLAVPVLGELVTAAGEAVAAEDELRARQAAGHYPDPDAALATAARAGDVYGLMERLLDATVLVPTTRPVEFEEIAEPGFPWRRASATKIQVFTSLESLLASHPAPPPYAEMNFSFVVACWPEGFVMAIDPDGEHPLEFGPEQVPWLFGFGQAEEPE